jgi:hypothetical protein
MGSMMTGRLFAVAIAAIATALSLGGQALAQPVTPEETSIQLQVHKTLPPGEDANAAFLDIFNQLRKDSEAVAKASGRDYTIKNINVFANPNFGGLMGGTIAGTKTLNGTATITLSPPPASAPSAPTAPGPAQQAAPAGK